MNKIMVREGKRAAGEPGTSLGGGTDGAPMTRSAILSHYAQVASSMQLDVAAMLRRVGLDAACLLNPNIPIPAIRAVELIELSAIEARSQNLGIRLALARGVPDLGPLNLLLREEPNLRSALRSMRSYFHLHSRSIRFALDEQGDIATLAIAFTLMAPLPFAAPQSTEMVVCGILQAIKWLIGTQWSPTLVCISHPAPADISAHRALLGCRVEFGHCFDGLVLPCGDLDRPITQSSPVLRKYAEEYVRSLASASPSDFQERVIGLIGALLPSGRCSATAVAHHLGMDRSTLSRRLAHVNQSYSSLLQATRVTLAGRSCLSGWPLAEVADQLGFADLSVFSRWFTRSFGCSARSWRRMQRHRSAIPTQPSV
jgi:AraC-like DNA-binding protein